MKGRTCSNAQLALSSLALAIAALPAVAQESAGFF